MHSPRIIILLGVLALSGCDASQPRDVDRAPPTAEPPLPARTALTDRQVAERLASAHPQDEPTDPARLCIRRVEGAPTYVRVGEREPRGGCRLAAVIYDEAMELRGGDTNRFESNLMRDLGWATASADQRGALMLRWLRESRFALAPGDGPFLVDGDLARSADVDLPSTFEEDGMPKVRYWQRAMRHTREAPDDWYWLYSEHVTTFDPSGTPLGTSRRGERRVPMDEAPPWASEAR